MKNQLFLVVLLVLSFNLNAEETFEHTLVGDSGPEACNRVSGEGRRKAIEKCKEKMDWDKFNISECKIEELPSKENKDGQKVLQFKGIVTVTYQCKSEK